MHRQRHLTAHHIGRSGGRRFVRNVLKLNVGGLLQHLANQMVQCAISNGVKVFDRIKTCFGVQGRIDYLRTVCVDQKVVAIDF